MYPKTLTMTDLLAKKELLLNEIKYYELKVKEESSASNTNNLNCDDSSDSECEFTVEVGLSITELKLKQRSLKTCLQATQELTGVNILQSEINILVQDPVLDRERPVREEGVWREVMAECRIDLVPFTINFYVHKPSRMFGPMSYRNLQVTPVKLSHEVELAKSVLSKARQPSDAIEIIRNYSAAHRSRRTTLARLAEKYGDALFMAPMPEGGYKLQTDLMEVQWTLQNKWSPLVPFHHRMVFDLEYMDESYLKTISTLHKQIINPVIDTDERTLLLAKIINTCSEAKSHATQNNESTESESEAAEKLKQRRTTLDQEPQVPEITKKKDSEVMAPPKTVPKKSKPKGKEISAHNKAKPLKRTAPDVGEIDAKKSKTITNDKVTETKNLEDKSKGTKTKTVATEVNNDKNLENNVNTNVDKRPSEKNPKNSEKLGKKDKEKQMSEVQNQEIRKNKVQTTNKDVKKSEKSKKIVQDNYQHQQNQKNDVKMSSNLVKENAEADKDLNKKKQDSEDINELNKEKKSSTNVIKSTIKQKQNVDKLKTAKSNNHKSNHDNGTQKITKDSKIIPPEAVNKNKGEINNKETTKKLKPVVTPRTSKEKTIVTKLPNLVKKAKDVNNPQTVNYLKNQFTKNTRTSKNSLTTKIPRISPRKLLAKPGVQDVSKSSRSSSQKSLQKATNIPRLLKKPQVFKMTKGQSISKL